MSQPDILFLDADAGARAQAHASFSSCPARLRTAAGTEAGQRLAAPDMPALVVAPAAAMAWISALRRQAQEGARDVVPVIACGFENEASALLAGAVAFASRRLAPAEARDLCALASGDAAVHATWAEYRAGLQHLVSGRLQEALEDLSALADEQPSFWRAHARLAIVWDLAGDPASAARHRAIAAQLLSALDAEASAALAACEDAAARAGRDESDAAAVVEPAAPPVAPAPPAAAAPLADILIADDSELVREILAEVLQSAGYAVRQAKDGKEAVELARRKRPDLAILDGLMPGKNGFEACQEIKQSVYRANPPKVVIFSAIYTKQRQRTEATQVYGVDEVLAKPTDKPLDEGEILAAVRRHIGR